MKKFFFLTLGLTIFKLSTLRAEEISVGLKLPPHFASQICTVPVWNNTTVYWKGLSDQRAKKEIGEITIRGKKTKAVVASPQLKSLLEAGIQELLTGCGMKFVKSPEPSEHLIQVSASIGEFYGSVDKKIISSAGTGKSQLNFVIESGSQKRTVNVGFTIESKDLRKPGSSPIESLLNELYLKTLEQIPQTPQMRQIGTKN